MSTIHWRHDANAVFAEAIGDGHDVLLWWTAPWCPPCNELDHTVFSHPAFEPRARLLHLLKLEADAPLAQRWGDRFGLRSYPALWLLDPGGLPRLCLPMAASAEVVCDAIALAQRSRPLAQLVQAAGDHQPTTPTERRLLALHWWSQDVQTCIDPAAREAMLANAFAQSAGDAPGIRLRLLVHWLDTAREAKAAARSGFAQALAALLANLEIGYAETYLLWVDLNALSVFDDDTRLMLLQACRDALEHQLADPRLDGTRRLIAHHARLHALSLLEVDASTQAAARVQAAADARRLLQACAPGEWLSVTNMAGHLLQTADSAEAAQSTFAQALAKAAHPGYFMQYLGDLAFEGGDVQAGLDWWAQARDASEGAATRVAIAVRRAGRWMKHAPFDVDGIDAAVRDALQDLAATDAPTAGNNRRNLELLMQQLQAWHATSGRCELGCDGALCG